MKVICSPLTIEDSGNIDYHWHNLINCTTLQQVVQVLADALFDGFLTDLKKHNDSYIAEIRNTKLIYTRAFEKYMLTDC